jgi:hypothetical protein
MSKLVPKVKFVSIGTCLDTAGPLKKNIYKKLEDLTTIFDFNVRFSINAYYIQKEAQKYYKIEV